MATWKTQQMLPTFFLKKIRTSIETTGGDASCLNENTKRQNIIIHNMVRIDPLEKINMQINGAAQQRHHHNSLDEISTVI